MFARGPWRCRSSPAWSRPRATEPRPGRGGDRVGAIGAPAGRLRANRVRRGALERDLPVLAICRGIQLLNVACGGTLVQHLEDVIDQTPHRFDDATWGEYEVVTVAGSRLREIVGERPHVRSHHHQGIG